MSEKQRATWTLPAHRGAYDKGVLAWQRGETEADCPYKGHSRKSFRNAWFDGFNTAAKENTDVV